MSTILITGSNGQLGKELKQLSVSYPSHTFLFTDYEELDITNAALVRDFVAKYKPHFVINCAAFTNVDKAESEPANALLLNTTAVENLAAACNSVSACLVHISTDYVFDGTSCKPYKENDATSPTSVYGQTKLQGEQVALSYSKSIVIRTAWLYSAFGNNFVKTMFKLGKERQELGVVFDQVGTPTHAADLAAAIMHIINENNTSVANSLPSILHYSNEGVCSWYDFAKKIMQLSRSECTVNPIETKDYPTPAKRPHYSVLNKSKIKSTYRLAIPHWEESLTKCISKLLND